VQLNAVVVAGNQSLHQAKSYSVVVTATSDTITRTLQIALTVQ